MKLAVICIALIALQASTALGTAVVNTFKILASIKDMRTGLPAANVPVTLYRHNHKVNDVWLLIDQGKTLENGQYGDFQSRAQKSIAGTYRIRYDVKQYFTDNFIKAGYPYVDVIFEVENPDEEYVYPVLLNAYGYTTYRGSRA